VGTDKNAGDTNPIIVPAAVAAVMLLGALGGCLAALTGDVAGIWFDVDSKVKFGL